MCNLYEESKHRVFTAARQHNKGLQAAGAATTFGPGGLQAAEQSIQAAEQSSWPNNLVIKVGPTTEELVPILFTLLRQQLLQLPLNRQLLAPQFSL
jgi:hypothetical protein